MLEAKKIVGKYKNLLETKKDLQEELRINKIEEAFFKNLCKLGDKNEKARRLKKVTKKIQKITQNIDKIDNAMESKKQYFEVTISSLISNIQKKLDRDFPDEGTRFFMRRKRAGRDGVNQNFILLGIELVNSKIKYNLPDYSCDTDTFISKEEILYLNQDKYKINLLTSGLIGDKFMQFADKDTQEMFWKMIENNLQEKINNFKFEKRDIIKNAKNDYKDKVGEFIVK